MMTTMICTLTRKVIYFADHRIELSIMAYGALSYQITLFVSVFNVCLVERLHIMFVNIGELLMTPTGQE